MTSTWGYNDFSLERACACDKWTFALNKKKEVAKRSPQLFFPFSTLFSYKAFEFLTLRKAKSSYPQFKIASSYTTLA
jgi:hypothetical protein